MTDISNVAPATETVVGSTPAAPPPGSDTQGSAPASVDTTANGQDTQGQSPDKQSRRDSRAFATYRRENRELNRELGRLQAEVESLRRDQSSEPPAGDGQTPRQERSPAQVAAEREFAEHARSVVERLEDAGEEIEGFEQVMEKIMAPNMPINRVMLDFLGETDKPALMAQWMADNPGEVRRISRLSEAVAIRALERAEASVAKPAPKKTTQAPPPVPTVGGRSTAEFDPEKASMDEYAAHWKERQAKRG